MAHMSRRFNFDDFDRQIAEALDEHERATDLRMAQEGIDNEVEQAWADHDRVFLGKVPGEIGGVLCRPSFVVEPLPDPPEAA